MPRRKKKQKSRYTFPHLPGYDPWRDAGDVYYYDEDAAERMIEVFRNELKFTKGKWKGKPFELADFQKDIIRCIFGWKRISDDVRRYRRVFLYIPRKNGKSEFVAGVALCVLFFDEENDAEIYIGARDRGQALTLYTMVESMRNQNQDFKSETVCYQTSKELKATWDNSKIQAISSDAMSQHSLSPHMGIIDEVHAQPNGDLIGAIETGMGGREQPLTFLITTADLERESVCNEELEVAKSVRDGVFLDERYLPIIYETPKDADPHSEETWKIANPNYPVTPNRDFMVDASNKARTSPRKLSEFCRYNLNMQTSSVEGWLNKDDWDACKSVYEYEDLRGQKCFAGLDLSKKVDLTAFCLLFETGESLCWFYTCQSAVDNDKTGRYRLWVESGDLILAGDERIDYAYMKRDLKQASEDFNVEEWAYDKYNASQLVFEMEKEGMEFVEFGQGFFSMNEPSKEFEARLLEGNFKHNHPILSWMSSNVTIKEDEAGNIKPMKPKRESPLKVDGIHCLVMATGLHMVYKEKQKSVYSERGIRSV